MKTKEEIEKIALIEIPFSNEQTYQEQIDNIKYRIGFRKGYTLADQQTKELRKEIEAKDKYIQDYKIQTDILITDMKEEIERLKSENKMLNNSLLAYKNHFGK